MSIATKRLVGATLAGTAALGLALGVVAPTADAAPKYSNCASLNADYPHGVGKPGAVDSTSTTPVTNFTVNADVYNANTARDRDNDGIACEKA